MFVRLRESLGKMQAEIRSAYKSEDTEEFFDRIFTKPLGYLFARLFIRIGWSPNKVTLLDMAIGFTGGVMFASKQFGWNLAGVLLVVLANILDSTDGQIARLTGQKSTLGRILDGISTGVWYLAIYPALCIRLMDTPVPFAGGALWGGWIWLVMVIAALAGHLYQCMMADYYRNIHLFFLKNHNGSELTRSNDVFAQHRVLSYRTKAAEKFFLFWYGVYTRIQELSTPAFQRLYATIREKHGGRAPDALRESFLTESRKYIQLTNILTFNTRAYTLFLLLLLNVPFWYFPFELLLLGALLIYTGRRYENICRTLSSTYDS